MWKKRLIATVTFVAGLYYVLYFFIPQILPWGKVTGKVVSVPAATQVLVDTGHGLKNVDIKHETVVNRFRATGGTETVETKALQVGDRVDIGHTTYLSEQLIDVNNFFMVLSALAWGMGLFSLWVVHTNNIRKRRPEWYLSIVFFAALVLGLATGWGSGKGDATTIRHFSDIVVNYVINPVGSTIFSLLTFYMASAAYRSFKAKSNEAILMMVSALIVMLGQIPVGLALTRFLQHTSFSFLQIPSVSQWILYIINSAAVKGMWFGMMLGAIAVGLRFWLSLERGAFFDREL